MRSAIVYYLLAGHVWFACGLIVAGVSVLDLFGFFATRERLKRFAHFLLVLVIPLALLTGTPMPLVMAIPVAIAIVGYAMTFGRRRLAAAAAILASLLSMAWEAQFFFAAPPAIARGVRIDLIGDSLSSGGFGETRLWQQRLPFSVRTLASPSETSEGALRDQVPRLDPRAPVVMIEIGGNDMLDRRGAAEFADNLDAILSAARGRTILLFELPLPPGAWGYGAAQRRLARKHGATLIPKRILADVLLDESSTGDGLHLTTRGHERLAAAVVRWLTGKR